jgi:hypothetical protein
MVKQTMGACYNFRCLLSQWNKFRQILRVSRTMKPPADDFQASKLGRARIRSEVETRLHFIQRYGVHILGNS